MEMKLVNKYTGDIPTSVRLHHLCLSCRCTVYILIRAATAPQMVQYGSHPEPEERHYQSHPADAATLSPGYCEDGSKL